MSKGDKLEILAEKHFKWLFEEMGFQVVEVRRQKTGVQFGFDILIRFFDDTELPRSFYFECKDYSTNVNWNSLLRKIFELDSSAHKPDAFIAISPKVQITNINHNTLQNCKSKFGFAIDLWDITNIIQELFALDNNVYYELYQKNYSSEIDSSKVIYTIKTLINHLINEKQILDLGNKIKILESDRNPLEDENLRTKLDLKLNAVLPEDDVSRIEYHKYRCDYKVYLEDLEDISNNLRSEIIDWQDNLRIKAYRLTNKFKLYEDYTPQKFFHDFFDEAGKDLHLILNNGKYTGDIEKLLNGIIFELAAQCPLDWRNENEF